MRSVYPRERGNVLFLILIAVALFAALSYAITQSSRSGSDANREVGAINTASLVQYPNQVRTAALRLTIHGAEPAAMEFNKPDEMSGAGYTALIPERAVFNTAGGSAPYMPVPAPLTAAGTPIDWMFNMDFMLPHLGSDAEGGTGNDLIAFAEGVSQAVCTKVDADFGYGATVPVLPSAVSIANNRAATTSALSAPTVTGVVLDDGETPNWFAGRAFGCFQNGPAGPYVFYFSLIER